jgi:hypothetical protein
MKLRSPYVWKSGLAALGVLSLVSFQSVSAQTATTTPASGSTSVTTPAAGNATTGQTGASDNGNANGGMPGANWGNGKRDQHDGRFHGGMKGPGGMMGGFIVKGRGEMRIGVAGVDPQAIADFLGLTTEQVKADLDAGQSLAQIAVAQGKTRDELKAFLVAQATTAIDAAIDATPTTRSNEAGTTTGGANATPAAGSTTAPSAASTPTT